MNPINRQYTEPKANTSYINLKIGRYANTVLPSKVHSLPPIQCFVTMGKLHNRISRHMGGNTQSEWRCVKIHFFDTPLMLYNTFGNGYFIVAPDLRDGRPPEEAEPKNVSCSLPRS